jgi:hypothetical protein
VWGDGAERAEGVAKVVCAAPAQVRGDGLGAREPHVAHIARRRHTERVVPLVAPVHQVVGALVPPCRVVAHLVVLVPGGGARYPARAGLVSKASS